MLKTKGLWEKVAPFGIPILISVISIAIGLYPLLVKPTTVFIGMDPDPMYVGNALQLLQTGKVTFTDHPGTPLISLLSVSYMPLKLYAKAVLHEPNFNVWFLRNIDFVYLFTRTVLVLVFFLGLISFHYILYKRFKSLMVNIFFGMMLFLDNFHYGMYGAITPEILAFTLTSVWLYLLWKSESSKNLRTLFAASLLSGIILSTKMSFMMVPFATFLFTLFKMDFFVKVDRFKVVRLLVVVLLIFAGFLIGVAPLWYRLGDVFSNIYRILVHTGTFGTGGAGIYDPNQFSLALQGWFSQPFVLIGFLMFAVIIAGMYSKEHLLKSLIISSILGIFVFMKYPVIHYQTANILLLVICLSILFTKIPYYAKFALLFITILFFRSDLNLYYAAKRQLVTETYNLQRVIDEKHISGKIVWEYAISRDFSVLRSLNWTSNFFINEFYTVYPNTLPLDPGNMGKISDFHYGSGYPIDSTCWDALVLQKETWDNFISVQKNPKMFFREEIPGTKMLLVRYRDQLNCKVNGKL